MLLKKQTVWLLTMLSLVVVLSVYYLTGPDQNSSNVASNQEEKDKQSTESTKQKEETAKISDKEVPKVAISSSDDEFEALRINIQDERSKLSEELTNKMGDTSLSAEEKNQAVEANNKLSETATTEQVLEYEIMQLNYPAALVRIDGNKVDVTVKTDEKLTALEVADIMDIVNTEMDDVEDVAVEFKLDEGK
ncbi:MULTISPECIES: SpoIIIAH-like family protein [Bacillaceae]|uniref:Stage III sporulation protein AH n=1 Tax=Peribacillus huizhouensis TaxID=1501239 RepID=A0ABR6CSQ2_9BACI|nr:MULTISPECIES: SpoIIIAH-like family protein [Bacillaceae]MBA9027387.1 stage III sporulation protein AH [Peribacillus huizhouensis]